MFTKYDPEGYSDPLPGIRMKTLCYGERTLMTEFRLSAGSELPLHNHVYEQIGYLVSGSLRLTIGSEKRVIAAGDSWCIGKNVQHGAQCLEDAVAVEVFSPIREDYIPADNRS